MQHRYKTILYILHDGGGGTVHTTNDLVLEVSKYYNCFILKFGLLYCSLFYVESKKIQLIASFQFHYEWRVHNDFDSERLELLKKIIDSIHPNIVHTRTFICSSTEILHLFKQYDIRIVNSFHDFHTICPNIQLIDFTGVFCGGDCNRNFKKSISQHDCSVSKKWFKDLPFLRNGFQKVYSEKNQKNLKVCNSFIVTSSSTKDVILANFPQLSENKFHIIEHGRDFSNFKRQHKKIRETNTNIIFFGALNNPKGLDLVNDLLETDSSNNFTIHILGNPDTPYFNSLRDKGAFLHGTYSREALPSLVDKINPFLSLVPSIWPETFCHTLTESWALGIPVLGSSLGAVGERIQKNGGGWILPPVDARVWYEKILSILKDKTDYQAQLKAIANMKFKTSAEMALEYVHVYDALCMPTDSPVTDCAMSATSTITTSHKLNSYNHFLGKAKYHINRKHWEIAEHILKKLFHETGDATSADAYWMLSMAYRRQGQLKNAVDIISSGMLRFPAHPSIIKEKKFLFEYIQNNFHPVQESKKCSIISTDSCKINQIPFFETHKTCIVMPCTDMNLGTKASSILLQRSGALCTIIIVHDTKKIGFINISNIIFSKTNSDYFIYLAQDSFPSKNWLVKAIEKMNCTGKSLLAFNDGKWDGKLASFGMIRRKWINTIYKNNIFYKKYKSHHADNELSIIAKIKDQYVYDPNIGLFEVDYYKETKPLGNMEDREIFIERCSTGFDGLVESEQVVPFAADYQIFL